MWDSASAEQTRGSSWVAVNGSLRDPGLEPIEAMEAYVMLDLEKMAKRAAPTPLGRSGAGDALGANVQTHRRGPQHGPGRPWIVRVDDNIPRMHSIDDSEADDSDA